MSPHAIRRLQRMARETRSCHAVGRAFDRARYPVDYWRPLELVALHARYRRT